MKSENWISAALSRAPPPKRPAVLPVKVTPVRLETPPAVNKPPPSVVVAIFEVNVPPLIVAVPAVSTNTPPPLICAPLPPKFVLSRVRVPELKIAPPRPSPGLPVFAGKPAWLLFRVEVATVAAAPFATIAPPSSRAVLLVKVVPVTIKLPRCDDRAAVAAGAYR